jgi:hypothetical protein
VRDTKDEEKLTAQKIMSARNITIMTEQEIRAEWGWNDNSIYSLIREHNSNSVQHCKITGGYTRGLYKSKRVWAVAQSAERQAAKGAMG